MKKKIVLLSVMFLIALILFILIINNIPNILDRVSESKASKETDTKLSIVLSDTSQDIYKIVVVANENKPVKRITYFDGVEVYSNSKTRIARDLEVEPLKDYKMTIEYTDGEIEEKSFNVEFIQREFVYTGGPQEYTIYSGDYLLEAYGAQGGTMLVSP